MFSGRNGGGGGTTDNTDPGFARYGFARIRLGLQRDQNNFQNGLSFEGGACVSYYVIGIPKGETKADWKVDRRGSCLPVDILIHFRAVENVCR